MFAVVNIKCYFRTEKTHIMELIEIQPLFNNYHRKLQHFIISGKE